MTGWRAVAGIALLAFAHSAVALEAPTEGPANSIGGAVRGGCLQGAASLPLSGPGWQVLRPAQNRFWGNPALVALITDQAATLRPLGDLLIGDMSLPRGGRMPTGHASHQTGLDADIMFRLSDHPLSEVERDDPDFTGVLAKGRVQPERWGKPQIAVLKSFAADPRVERIFVNPVIKRHLCATEKGDRSWLHVIRAWWGHEAHFHVRLACPAGDLSCESGPVIMPGDGCGAELDWWFSKDAQGPETAPTAPVTHPRYLPTMPVACKAILQGY